MDNIIVELSQVSRHFKKGQQIIRAVDDVSISIQRGDFIAIQGSSGSGKSTLLHLIGALDWPSTGRIFFDKQDVSGFGDSALSRLRRERLGFVFQSFNLIPDLNVLQNVLLPLKYAKIKKSDSEKRALQALEKVNMTHRLSHFPSELSGGEEQRVSIARALVNRPDIILADEPTGNLDTENRDNILTLFDNLHKGGQTIIVVTHDAQVARKAACRYHMENGRLSKIE